MFDEGQKMGIYTLEQLKLDYNTQNKPGPGDGGKIAVVSLNKKL